MSDVCVLMPNYNNGSYIKQAIESVLSQTYKCDLIIIDDGSTDDSVNIINEYEKVSEYEGINFIAKKNGGPSSARNEGLSYIIKRDYKYTILLDSDDYLYPRFAERALEVMEFDEEIIGVYFDYDIHINEPNLPEFKVREFKRSFNYEELWQQCLIPHLAMIKTEAFIKVVQATGGLYDEGLRVCNDYDMDLKLAQHGILWHEPELMAVVREGVNNSCSPIQGKIREDCMMKLRRNNYRFYQ